MAPSATFLYFWLHPTADFKQKFAAELDDPDQRLPFLRDGDGFRDVNRLLNDNWRIVTFGRTSVKEYAGESGMWLKARMARGGEFPKAALYTFDPDDKIFVWCNGVHDAPFYEKGLKALLAKSMVEAGVLKALLSFGMLPFPFPVEGYTGLTSESMLVSRPVAAVLKSLNGGDRALLEASFLARFAHPDCQHPRGSAIVNRFVLPKTGVRARIDAITSAPYH